MWRIYLDTCCLNRPFDNSTDSRVLDEATAVIRILREADHGVYTLLSSEILVNEIDRISNAVKRAAVTASLKHAMTSVTISSTVSARAKMIQAGGVRASDSLHLACAEFANADILLTVDDRLIRAANRNRTSLAVRVLNPVEWLEEQDQ